MAETRQLRIIKCEPIKSTNDWTLYEVEALDANGGYVQGPFRSFAQLPLNELRDYESEPRDSDRFGRSFTLKLAGQGGGGGTGGGTSLGQSLDELREEFRAFKTWMLGVLAANNIELGAVPPSAARTTESDVPPDTEGLPVGAGAGTQQQAEEEDIPF